MYADKVLEENDLIVYVFKEIFDEVFDSLMKDVVHK
jgi:hypothetical protein